MSSVASSKVYEGWKGIAGALNRSIKTAREWARSRGLPVRVLGGTVYMNGTDLDAWRKVNDKPFLEHVKERESGTELTAASPKAA